MGTYNEFRSTWRLLNTGHQCGALNMAIDEAILWAHSKDRVPPTLRFYGWRPAAVSLGYSQPATDVDFAQCREIGVDVVRRPTGGRAILHDDEITYSVVVDERLIPAEQSVIASYQWISSGLIEGLRLMGITVALQTNHSHAAAQPRHDSLMAKTASKSACFAHSARCDLVHCGRKLGGSAQMRKGGCILQHGSLPLSLDRCLIRHVLKSPGNLHNAVALNEIVTVRPILFNTGVQLLIAGFSSALSIIPEEGDLTSEEKEKCAEFLSKKHERQEWVVSREIDPNINHLWMPTGS